MRVTTAQRERRGGFGDPLRLVVLAHPRHPVAQPFAGGMESHTWHLCRELTTLGVHTTLFAPEGSDPAAASELRTYAPITLSPTARRDSTRPTDTDLYEHHAMAQAISAITGEGLGAVVHNQTLHHLPILTAGLLPPMVTTLHTPPFSWLESAITVGLDTGRFAAVSRFIADEFAALAPIPPRVIHNGVDTDLFRRGPGGEAMVWTGRFVPEKAPHLAVEVARRTGRPLRLMGPISDPSYFDEFIRPALGSGIEYLGHLDRAAVAAELQQAAVSLVTSMWPEPFGLTAAEAMSCGTPVVGFRVGGLAEVVAEPEAGTLVPAADMAAMAAAVADAAALDRSVVSAIAQLRFSMRTMALAYLELFGELADQERIDRAG